MREPYLRIVQEPPRSRFIPFGVNECRGQFVVAIKSELSPHACAGSGDCARGGLRPEPIAMANRKHRCSPRRPACAAASTWPRGQSCRAAGRRSAGDQGSGPGRRPGRRPWHSALAGSLAIALRRSFPGPRGIAGSICVAGAGSSWAILTISLHAIDAVKCGDQGDQLVKRGAERINVGTVVDNLAEPATCSGLM